MKKTLVLALLLSSHLLFAQDDNYAPSKPGKDLPEDSRHPESYKSKSGLVFKIGDDIHIGVGSLPYGDFSTITKNESSLFRGVSSNNAAAANYNALSKTWSGYKKQIIRFDRRGNEKRGYKTVAVINIGLERYQVEIDAAIEKGEIEVPEQYRPKQNAGVIIQQTSSADELLKYKKLMDDGIITKEEFEAKKKKILDN